MASELATNVFTPQGTPDYLGHYAELVKSIPNAGLQFLAAQKAAAENARQIQEFQLAQQKAKAFVEMYPAFKAAQIAKLNAEAALYPSKISLLESQAAYQKAHAASMDPANYPAGTNYFGSVDERLKKLGPQPAPTTFDPLAGPAPRSEYVTADGSGAVPGTADAPPSRLKLGTMDPFLE